MQMSETNYFYSKTISTRRRFDKKQTSKILKGTQTAWNKFLRPAINATAPFIGMAVSAKTKNPKVGQATTNILKSISGGKILSLTDMHGHGLRLKVM